MTYDHTTTTIHRAAVDHDIDTIRNERVLARTVPRNGIVDGIRRNLGRVLIASGTALMGRDATLRTHRA